MCGERLGANDRGAPTAKSALFFGAPPHDGSLTHLAFFIFIHYIAKQLHSTMAVGSASLQDRLERWAQRLNNLTVSPLARDYDTPTDTKRAIEAFETLKLPQETQLALKKHSESSSSEFTVFLTAFVLLVARLTGDEECVTAS